MMLGTIEILSSACQALPDKLPMLTSIAGLSKRIIELFDALELYANQPMPEHLRLQRPPPEGEGALWGDGPDGGGGGAHHGALASDGTPLAEPEYKLAVHNLAYSTPDGRRQLARDLSFVVEEGMGVVIRGPSGCGKTSLLRCMAGLWQVDSGEVHRPVADSRHGVCFLPQRPYMPSGTLRQQVIYPEIEREPQNAQRWAAVDARVSELLTDMNLAHTLDAFGLTGVAVWEDVLSLGEQQRLSFARVLYAQPRFVIMDEATSALDLQNEAECMQRLLDEEIALLTIAHRPSVVRYHQLMLTMEPDGSFTPTPLIEMTPC